MYEWQPIETAPRNGSWLWVYVPSIRIPKNNGKFQQTMARYLSAKWHPFTGNNKMHSLPKQALMLGEKFGGYWTSHQKGRTPTAGMPTHWMPLPPPPSVNDTGEILAEIALEALGCPDCGAGDDNHHSWTCKVGLHPDKKYSHKRGRHEIITVE